MKKLFLIFLFVLTMPFSYASAYTQYEFPSLVANNNVIYTKLRQAESMILGVTYENQGINIRLNRLEKVVFNRTYPRLSNEQRINNVLINYQKNITNKRNYINQRRVGNAIKGLSSSIGSFFYGYPTGMSPQIYPQSLPPEYHRGVYTNHGWREHNIYNNSGFGVKILD